ncbi:SH3 domain-containing protein [Thermodesulfobacteriota bacterium]
MRMRNVFCAMIFLMALFVFNQDAYAGQYIGKVVGLSPKTLAVQGPEGKILRFAIGWKTKYYPNRAPRIGERVKVYYKYGRRGYTGYSVSIIRHSPPPVNDPEIKLSGKVSVIVSKANIRTGPGTSYKVIATAREREVLSLEGQTGAWYKVFSKPNKTTGWIFADLVRVDSRSE